MLNINLKTSPQSAQEKFELLDLLIENMGVNILVADKDGNMIYANKGAADTYDCDKDTLLKLNAYTIQKEGWIDRQAALEEVLVNKRPIKRYIRTGKSMGMIISAVPIFDERGDVQFAIATGYNEKEFLSMMDNFDREKNQLQAAISYLTKMSSGEMYYHSSNPKMQYVYFIADRAAASDSAVIIYGSSGTGKEVLAKYIHMQSPRHDRVFLPINCAAIPSELIESEFFGYEKGSFTGASEKGKPGLFEIASNGTLFLDEIGELSLQMQAKLLRVLETGEFMKIGAKKVSKTSARIIGATNRDLKQMVTEGTFREDLYYRLNVIPIRLPDLRERPEDIEELSELFLEQINEKMGSSKYFSEDTIEAFKNYSWPGNIRELRNYIERLAIVNPGREICMPSDALYRQTGELNNIESNPLDFKKRSTIVKELYGSSLKEAVLAFEIDYIQETLKENDGNVAAAARALGVQRSTIYNIKSRIDEKEK